ncbi:MAG TPA: c-type cytochrome [Tepidisphaeraceae bacterium]|nr:c-type cytochrome [Tepidisphaeraceae bacterium]
MRALFVIILAMLLCAGCEREKRTYKDQSPSEENTANHVVQSDLHPGMIPPPSSVSNEYEESAYATAQGQTLFSQYHCSGCHFHGGGGIGPPLMDDQWIYGSDPQNIRSVILEGRPNGMPSFRGKIPDHQVWEIVAYVRSLSGLLPKDISPGRTDHMNSTISPQQTPPQQEKKEAPGLNRAEKKQ